jgi:excisionase family DNA binding protein
MANELLLRIDDVAERLSCCRSVVYRWVRLGLLPSLKIGGSRRVLASELEAFVERLRDQSDETKS